MKRTISLFFLATLIVAAYPNGSRVPGGNSGEPGTGTPCASCHSVTLNPSSGSVRLTLPSEGSLAAGATHRMTVVVTDSNASYRKGFQLAATGGTFAAVTSTVVSTSSGRQYVNHTSSAASYAFDWTAPATAGDVTFYLGGAAVNGTRNGNAYTSTVTVSVAAASVTPKPSITPSGVVNGASFSAGISAGSWLTVFGSNLAPTGVARSWTGTDIVNGALPTTLENTQVKINGKLAAIAYVSPTQLNVQAPADTSTGTVAVEVIVNGVASDSAFADLRTAAPGFFRFSPSNYKYLAAVHSDGTLVGAAGLLSGVTTVAAKPAGTILLFGTGFGATDPAVAPGVAFSGAAPLASGNALSIRIGGVAAQVTFAGLSSTGLYQFNVVVPALADGDHAVEASAWGQSVPTQQYLTIKN